MDSVLLRAFLETADAGSVSAAARRLGISQPSLTLQIQRLEQRLNARLFDRHGRGVAMSESGKALYPRARRILDEAEHDVIELVDTMDEAAARVAELAAR